MPGVTRPARGMQGRQRGLMTTPGLMGPSMISVWTPLGAEIMRTLMRTWQLTTLMTESQPCDHLGSIRLAPTSPTHIHTHLTEPNILIHTRHDIQITCGSNRCSKLFVVFVLMCWEYQLGGVYLVGTLQRCQVTSQS